jgi:hypothetical protein
LLSRMTSEDSGKTSLHAALRNGHSESLNREALIAVMKQDGLALVRESGAPAALTARLSATLQDAKAYFFKGNGKEGIATVARDGQGQTNIVLNATADLESFGR